MLRTGLARASLVRRLPRLQWGPSYPILTPKNATAVVSTSASAHPQNLCSFTTLWTPKRHTGRPVSAVSATSAATRLGRVGQWRRAWGRGSPVARQSSEIEAPSAGLDVVDSAARLSVHGDHALGLRSQGAARRGSSRQCCWAGSISLWSTLSPNPRPRPCRPSATAKRLPLRPTWRTSTLTLWAILEKKHQVRTLSARCQHWRHEKCDQSACAFSLFFTLFLWLFDFCWMWIELKPLFVFSFKVAQFQKKDSQKTNGPLPVGRLSLLQLLGPNLCCPSSPGCCMRPHTYLPTLCQSLTHVHVHPHTYAHWHIHKTQWSLILPNVMCLNLYNS